MVNKYRTVLCLLGLVSVALVALTAYSNGLQVFVRGGGVSPSLDDLCKLCSACNSTQSPETHHTDTNPVNKTKVLLLTYMRGGSTLLGDIFNTQPDTFHWFEPVDSLYYTIFGTRVPAPIDNYFKTDGSIRKVPAEEEATVLEYLKGLYSCDPHQMSFGLIDSWLFQVGRQQAFASYAKCSQTSKATQHAVKYPGKCDRKLAGKCRSQLSTNTHPCAGQMTQIRAVLKTIGENEFSDNRTASPGKNSYAGTILGPESKNAFSEYGRCYASHYRRTAACWPELTNTCRKSRFITAKTIRLRARTAVKLLEADPHLKVVYFVRDPRGVVLSRRSTGGVSSVLGRRNSTREARYLCEMMADDYSHLQSVWDRFGERILVEKYENLIMDSDAFVKRLYDFLGVALPERTKQWIHSLTHKRAGKVTRESAFGTFRLDPAKTAFKWKTSIAKSMNASIVEVCAPVLKLLNYDT